MVSKTTKKGLITAGVGIGSFLGGLAVGHFAIPKVIEAMLPPWVTEAKNRIDFIRGGKYLEKFLVLPTSNPDENKEYDWKSCYYVIKQDGWGTGTLYMEQKYNFGELMHTLWIVTKCTYAPMDIVFDGAVVATLEQGLPAGWKKQIGL